MKYIHVTFNIELGELLVVKDLLICSRESKNQKEKWKDSEISNEKKTGHIFEHVYLVEE